MKNFRYALMRMMAGRYGHDALNITLVVIALLLSLLSNLRFTGNQLFGVVSYILLLTSFYRMFSKQISKRRKENQAFLKFFTPLRRQFKLARQNASDTQRKYFHCPTCKRTVRVPKGRGKVEITCPTCRTQFTKRT